MSELNHWFAIISNFPIIALGIVSIIALLTIKIIKEIQKDPSITDAELGNSLLRFRIKRSNSTLKGAKTEEYENH